MLFRRVFRGCPAKAYIYMSQYPLKTIALSCLVAIVAHVPAFAQGETERAMPSFGDLTGMDMNPLQQMARFPTMAQTVPLEGAVDPQEYLIGPGDLFHIAIGGAQPIMVTLPVSADGYLLLPDAGAIDIAGRALNEARELATRRLRAQFQNVTVDVTLAQPRKFYVHVSGAVPTPGRFMATPVARVATVLAMAYADTSRPPVSNATFRPALRNIKLIHRDGSEDTVDLLRYYSTGNTKYNPYLQDGDVISIPTYDPNHDAVFVSGNVAFPGTYDHRTDDTLLDLLILATGQDPPSGFERVRLTRTGPDGSVESEIYNVSELSDDVHVDELDQVHALPDELVRGTATIEGWVHFPGTYSIVTGETSIQALVEMAGGLRDDALERSAYLQRATLPLPEVETTRRNRFEFAPEDLSMVRTDEQAVLQSTRLATLDFMSRAYLEHELRLQNRVPLDLNAALHDEIGPIPLQNGDRVFVPRDLHSVFVLGQVNRPGYVRHEPGRPFEYYIEESGGFAENAGRVYVIEAGTGRYLDAENATVQSGDKIFVDRDVMTADTPELYSILLQERRSELEERSRLVQTIVSAIGAAGTIVTMYYLIRQTQ